MNIVIVQGQSIMAAFCHAKNMQMEEIQWQMLKSIIMNRKQRDFENDEARSGCKMLAKSPETIKNA